MRANLAPLLLAFGASAYAGDFADRVLSYTPAPGLSVQNPDVTDPGAALGPPSGEGTVQGAATGIVSLGGFAGELVLAFDQTVLDDPRNPLGLDAVVFGNAFWACTNGCAGTDPVRRWAEAGVIEISRDVNGNGLADDPWFVIRGPALPPVPASAFRSQGWPDGTTTAGFELPPEFAPPPPFFLLNPDAPSERHWGYADLSPTLRLGDYSGAFGLPGEDATDDPEDHPAASPDDFYTFPDDPLTVGIDTGAPGGDAFDIAWAVEPATGAPANLDGFDFLRVRTGVMTSLGPLGETSTDVDAVADVRALGDFDGDDAVGASDLAALLAAWGTPDPRKNLDGLGTVGSSDLARLLANWGTP